MVRSYCRDLMQGREALLVRRRRALPAYADTPPNPPPLGAGVCGAGWFPLLRSDARARGTVGAPPARAPSVPNECALRAGRSRGPQGIRYDLYRIMSTAGAAVWLPHSTPRTTGNPVWKRHPPRNVI